MVEVTRHLAILNDHFRRVFESHHKDLKKTAGELQSGHKVDLSGESANTKGNAAAWKERKISIQGTEIYCDLHLKLSPTANRIHFHPGHPAIACGKVIVGIFHEHLPNLTNRTPLPLPHGVFEELADSGVFLGGGV